MKRMPAATILLLLSCLPLAAQQVRVQEHVLGNGLKVLMVPRKGDPNVAAGWIAKVGSVNERPGITGVCHLFEHMMFKGTHVVGTKDIKKDLELLAQIDSVKSEIRKEEQAQIQRLRLGEISDLADPKHRTPHHQQLLDELDSLQKQEKDLIVKNEFDKIYTGADASGTTAIMCSEENPAQCHRRHLIAKYLLANHPEVKVTHIRGDGTVYGAASITEAVDAPAGEQLSLF